MLHNREQTELAISSSKINEFETGKTIMLVHVEYKMNMIFNENLAYMDDILHY